MGVPHKKKKKKFKLKAYRFPLDGLEEGVGHDLHEAGLLVTAQTVSGVLVEEALED